MLTLRDETRKRFEEEGQSYDIVMGAKGSPLQLVLSSLYFMDVPTGNILYSDYLHLRGADLAVETATDTEITATIPAGTLLDQEPLLLKVVNADAGQTGSRFDLFSSHYDGPAQALNEKMPVQIASVAPSQLPKGTTSEAIRLTIRGRGFGASPRVVIGRPRRRGQCLPHRHGRLLPEVSDYRDGARAF